MSDSLSIDGSHGEGGGQVLRTALSLAAITGRKVCIQKIRAGRKNSGLAAQHLTAVRAAASICGAQVRGDKIGSQELTFAPSGPPRAGNYVFDIAEAREGGSAGSATLLLQTLLLPLVFAEGESTLVLRGGTHVAWSPPFDYACDVWLPALSRMGVKAEMELVKWGWYPAGGGEIRARIQGIGLPEKVRLAPLTLIEGGRLTRVRGRTVAANLPSHIPQRMADRARSLLREFGVETRIEPLRVRAVCPGAGIFLAADRENVSAGFSALGRRGLSSEAVAEEAVGALRAYCDSGAAADSHLGDQLLLPMALAGGESTFTVERVTRHLTTNAWVVEQFSIAEVMLDKNRAEPRKVNVQAKHIGA
ncbi:MAG: RNA 3'-terminal phosphate cyclase [Nitrospinota bacterium]